MLLVITIIIFFIVILIKTSLIFRNQSKINCVGSSNWTGYYFKNKCPKVESSKNKIWGPMLWNSLHVISENYPKNPEIERQKSCRQFINGLPYMLPCGECGYNLKNFIKDRDLGNICRSRAKIRRFFVESHNHINRHLNKSCWTTEEAEEYYSKIPSCLSNISKWSSHKTI